MLGFEKLCCVNGSVRACGERGLPLLLLTVALLEELLCHIIQQILHILLDGTNEDGSNENENHEAFEKCLDFIFDLPDNVNYLTKIVNHADVSKNVPLHYATNWFLYSVFDILSIRRNHRW